MKLRLTMSDDGAATWSIDSSYGVHPDMKGHTGGSLTFGKGAPYNTSTKQKLVTRSSTECEVVGTHDVLPQVLWTNHFLEEQGFNLIDTVILQDNMSAMLLEKNGRMSSGRRTRHMDVRYFYIKDCIDRKEVRVVHCPTDDMVGDFFTKPLQGAKFHKLRDAIMNIGVDDKYHSHHRSVLSKDVPDGLSRNEPDALTSVNDPVEIETRDSGESLEAMRSPEGVVVGSNESAQGLIETTLSVDEL